MNGKNTACFSRQSDEWETPQWLFDLMNEEYGFDIDAAASLENRKLRFHFSDALERTWYDPEYHMVRFWLNPPYSKIAAFMKKAYEESQKGATVVCLIPCRTDTRYWHDYVMKAQEIRFIKGRVKFGGAKNGAPFPSCIIIFDIHRRGLGGPHPDIGETIEQPKKVKA